MDKGRQPASGSLYSPLSKESRQIRLLKIIDSTGEKLRCEIYPVKLTAELKFSALSYVWGSCADPENQATVIVNGLDKVITKSLESALRHVREAWKLQFPGRSESLFRLWADALCINQNDIPEKNHQVGLMADIYPRAELVLAWIGPDKDDILALLFQSIDMINRAVDANEGVRPKTGQEAVAMLRTCNAPLLSRETGPDTLNRRAGSGLLNPEVGSREGLVKTLWGAVYDFLRLPNWRRVWIYQEIIPAQKVVICSSSTTCPAEPIAFAIQFLRLVHDHIHQQYFSLDNDLSAMVKLIPSNFMGLSGFRGIFFKYQARQLDPESHSTLTNGDAVFGFNCEATDPRDHVFGALSMCTLDLQPDYAKSFGEVQIEFAAALFRSEERSFRAGEETHGTTVLESLLSVATPKIAAIQGAPSWVPFPKCERNPPLYTERGTNTLFRHAEILENPSVGGRALCLQGTQLGVIHCLYDLNKEHHSSEISQERLRAVLRSKLLRRPIEIYTLQTMTRLLSTGLRRASGPKDLYIFYALALLTNVAGVDGDGTFHDHVLSIRGILASLGLGLDPEGFFESFCRMFGTSKYCQRDRRIRSTLERIWYHCNTERGYLNHDGRSLERPMRLPPPLRGFELAEMGGGEFGNRQILTSKDAQVGDSICAFHGSARLYVLRKHSEEWQLVGPCELAEIRDGALVKEVELPVGTRVERFRVV
ncbi:hypothetical protein RB596_006777 [Gaeumannomyces avenae]